MSAKHRDPEYHASARIIRQQVNRAHRRGESVPCWRCHRPIPPGMPWDVGHINPAGGNAPRNLAPEHRHRVGTCRGNRSAGGLLGAQIRNRTAATRGTRSTGMLTW